MLGSVEAFKVSNEAVLKMQTGKDAFVPPRKREPRHWSAAPTDALHVKSKEKDTVVHVEGALLPLFGCIQSAGDFAIRSARNVLCSFSGDKEVLKIDAGAPSGATAIDKTATFESTENRRICQRQTPYRASARENCSRNTSDCE